MTADELLDLLRIRHAKDVFVDECKNGPSYGYGTMLRLDAWAMAKSWTRPALDGYEIKVSRSDFLGDNKMHLYAPLCNRLWVVCPTGLIDPREVPEACGLLWSATTGTRLMTKKKAPYREIDEPGDVFRYILMWRAVITREHRDQETREERFGVWKDFVERRAEMKTIGGMVSQRLREEASLAVAKAKNEMRAAEREKDDALHRCAQLHEADQILRELGVSTYQSVWQVREAIRDLLAGGRLVRALESARNSLQIVENVLRQTASVNQVPEQDAGTQADGMGTSA